MKRLIALGAILALLAPSRLWAAADPAGVVALRAPLVVSPGQAYILVRTNKAKSGIFPLVPVFLRAPTDQELADYRTAKAAAYQNDLPRLSKQEGGPPDLANYPFTYKATSNVFALRTKDAVAETEQDRTWVLQVPPGEYVLYGSTLSGAPGLAVCNCLGTVKFRADAGAVTDLGTLLLRKAADKAPEPELASETGLGDKIQFAAFVIAVAVRPATPSTSVPAGIPADMRRLADYRPVPAFIERGAGMINRLAPLPGVFRYENGAVVDDRTGNVVE